MPEGATIRVVEDTARDVTLVIPHRPTELSDEALTFSAVTGGGGQFNIKSDKPR